MQHNGDKDTTPFHIYKSEVAAAAGIPVASMHIGRLHEAYDMGEPVWMVADEMKLRAEANLPAAKSYRLPNLDRVCTRRVKI